MAGGLKIHEDLAAFPSVIDCCLSVAEQMDVAVALQLLRLRVARSMLIMLKARVGAI